MLYSLVNIEQNLSKWDTIETSVSDIQTKVARLENKAAELDKLKHKVNVDFVSVKSDEWVLDKQHIKCDVKALQELVSSYPDCIGCCKYRTHFVSR